MLKKTVLVFGVSLCTPLCQFLFNLPPDLQVTGAPGAKAIRIADDVHTDWAALAERLDGFSGRQIMKFCNSLQVWLLLCVLYTWVPVVGWA